MRRLARPPRVLMTTDAVGGVWEYAMTAGAALSAQGVDVQLAGFGQSPSEAQRDCARRRGLKLLWTGEPLDWTLQSPRALDAPARVLDGLVGDLAPDILHVNGPALAGRLRADVARVAVAHSCLATWWWSVRQTTLPDAWRWHQRATAAGLAAADVAIAPSRAYADCIAGVCGPVPGLRVVYNAVRPITPMEKRPIVLAAGRWWDDAKDLTTLDAAARDAAWPVLIAGPLTGPGASAAVAVQHARWVGDLPNRALRARTARAGIFLSTARFEPFGLAVLEAATAGAALVLSDIPTFRELWGAAALYVAPGDAPGFGSALNALIGDAPRRAHMGREAQQRALRYSSCRLGAELLACYGAAAQNRARAA